MNNIIHKNSSTIVKTPVSGPNNIVETALINIEAAANQIPQTPNALINTRIVADDDDYQSKPSFSGGVSGIAGNGSVMFSNGGTPQQNNTPYVAGCSFEGLNKVSGNTLYICTNVNGQLKWMDYKYVYPCTESYKLRDGQVVSTVEKDQINMCTRCEEVIEYGAKVAKIVDREAPPGADCCWRCEPHVGWQDICGILRNREIQANGASLIECNSDNPNNCFCDNADDCTKFMTQQMLCNCQGCMETGKPQPEHYVTYSTRDLLPNGQPNPTANFKGYDCVEGSWQCGLVDAGSPPFSGGSPTPGCKLFTVCPDNLPTVAHDPDGCLCVCAPTAEEVASCPPDEPWDPDYCGCMSPCGPKPSGGGEDCCLACDGTNWFDPCEEMRQREIEARGSSTIECNDDDPENCFCDDGGDCTKYLSDEALCDCKACVMTGDPQPNHYRIYDTRIETASGQPNPTANFKGYDCVEGSWQCGLVDAGSPPFSGGSPTPGCKLFTVCPDNLPTVAHDPDGCLCVCAPTVEETICGPNEEWSSEYCDCVYTEEVLENLIP